MEQYLIATASTCDLPRTYLEAHHIPFISYTYSVGGEVFDDDCREDTRERVYAGMRGGDRLKTSMINEFVYMDFFRSLLRTGKDVLFLDMSREMSVSYKKSLKAAEAVRGEFPDRRIRVMDTRCISGGLGLLVKSMVARMEAGMPWEEIIRWGEDHKLKIAHRFTVDDLNYLKEGGRVSNPAALVGSILAVKPVLYVPDRGTLDAVKKVRGRKNALKAVYESVCRDLGKADVTGREMLILHADCREDAEWIRDGVRRDFPEFGPIGISGLGVVIGAHCGPGLLAVFYYAEGRNPI